MILKKLTIEQFGKIEHFDVLFHEQIAAITVPDADGIAKAIGLAIQQNKRCKRRILGDKGRQSKSAILGRL